MQELFLKRKHLFFLHFFTNYCESQRTHMIIFCGSQAQIPAKKTRFALKISSDLRSAAGEPIITGNVRRSDSHWGTLVYGTYSFISIIRRGLASADPEGEQEIQTPPPGKSQVIWVSIGNQQLDPPWNLEK